MSDTLLFLHVLSAAALFSAVVVFSAIALGARMEPGGVGISLGLWRGGLLGVVLFGIALALDVDGVELWDVWVLIALVLWFIAGGAGEQLAAAYRKADGAALPQSAVGAHWFTVLLVVLLLADMIWKPWA
jgi:hypothetical protein